VKRIALFVALAFVSSAALAARCPKEMKAIDAAMSKAKPEQMAEIKKLRADGEALHKAGKHAESTAALDKAKGMLGLK